MLSVIVTIASINAVAGDRSAELGYVTGPTEQDRIRGHLLYAHATLSAIDVSALPPSLREARRQNLDRLLVYARAGQFPRNDGHPDARRPTFVDDDGDICAVGALYASDRGFAEAARISQSFKYAFIPQIVDADLHAWQRTSGLTPGELALIQPAYGWEDREYYAPQKLHTPWGLTDRAQFGPSRFGITTEVSGFDNYDTVTSSFYGHTALPGRTTRPWNASVYLAMPFGFALADRESDLAAAGGAQMRSATRHWYGNGDVGVFIGREDRDEGTASLVRFGALLPTATIHDAAPSMRVGDFVQELPRSYGARISHTRMVGWTNRRGTTDYAVRFDAGVDYAREVGGEHAQHYVPRANLGLLVSKELASISFDTAIAHVFDDEVAGSLRWSGGTTVRLTTPCGFQPALTFAAVRTTEGWGGAFALEIAMAPR